MGVIDVKNLTKDYGFSRGVFNVSFSINKGEVFGFLGPNGAGKSTTIRHLLGFSKPDEGETLILDLPSFNNYYKFLNNVGYIPGEIALPQGLTGWQFIRMMQNLQHKHNEKQLTKMLNLFELDDIILKTETKRMSLGDKRKLAIVVAFMNDPDILVLDEPTSGLDPVMQEVFIELIKKEKEKGKTILLSSHIFSEVDATCDRIAIIKDGKIVSEFIADELKHASMKNYKVYFNNENDYNQFLETYSQEYIKLLDKNDKDFWILVAVDDSFINKFISVLTSFNIKKFSNIKDIKHTFKECSKYGNKEYLVDSKIKTINFDKLSEWFIKPKPQSADSLSFSDSFLYLIEFKSGDQTIHERKLDKLIAGVIGKINDSDNTLSSLYSEAFKDGESRLKQKFCLVVDSKKMGITPLVGVLTNLSLINNSLSNPKEKILFDKVKPDLKAGVEKPEHYSEIELWYSELFDQYIRVKKIKSSVVSEEIVNEE